MQIAVENFEKDRSDDVEKLKLEVEALRRQLGECPRTGKPLAWDTELLVKKTQNLSESNIVSCADPDWQEAIEHIDIGHSGIRVNDVRTVEQIEFVAEFAAKRELAMTYGNRSFHLGPRPTPFDFD
jgi:hypothetical protein